MKYAGIFVLLALLTAVAYAAPRTEVEISISDMACPACARTVAHQLRQLPGVARVDVSLQRKSATVVVRPGAKPDLAALTRTIENAGFTPGRATVRVVTGGP